jgi:LysR family cys regulon transcriptional activator
MRACGGKHGAMNLNQLRFVREAVRQNFNLSAAAEVLFTSQPGVSKGIIELELELGVEIFVRHGKRIKSLTGPGQAVLPIIERLLHEAENLKRVGTDFASQDAGNLVIATTHTQARYTLPPIVRAFRERYPAVRLSLLQGSPPQLAEMVLQGHADVAVATETIADVPGLVSIPCFEWEHVAVVPNGHELVAAGFAEPGAPPLSIEKLASYPIVTYDPAFAGRRRIDEAFRRRAIHPDVVLEAIDADVIKTYVIDGMGVGIVAAIAVGGGPDAALRSIPVGHLFGRNVTRLAVRRGTYLRGYVYTFMELLAPSIDRAMIERLMFPADQASSTYQL